MATRTIDGITVENNNGMLELYTIDAGNYLFRRRYLGYAIHEAISEFKYDLQRQNSRYVFEIPAEHVIQERKQGKPWW
jgi:hypothetical protein